MADCKTTETHGLALVPLRNGKLLTNNNASRAQTPGKSTNRATGTTNSRALIPLWHRKNKATANTNTNRQQEHPTTPIIIGRPQLLPCLYAACGCHSKIYSTKHKCRQCQEVSEWAVRALSRQMLCVIVSEKHLVAVRGAHAIVVCDSQVVCKEDSTRHNHHNMYDNKKNKNVSKDGLCWRGSQRIQAGSKLEFREAEGDGLVEFQVVLVNIKTRKIMIPKDKRILEGCVQHQAPSRKKDLVHLPPRPKNNNKTTTTMMTTSPASFKKTQGGAQFRIWFVPLGQDLSRQRITLLSQQAEKRGAQVVTDDFRLATHFVISEQVTNLQQVAQKLMITQEDLKCHLDQVSVCRLVSFGFVWFRFVWFRAIPFMVCRVLYMLIDLPYGSS